MTLEGKQIGRYHIVRLLGSGGMGDVYLAEDPRIGQQIAVKVVRTEAAPYPDEDAAKEAERRFQREAKVIVRLDHPRILPLYDYGEEHLANMHIIYLVMPYRPEGSLSDWLRRRGTKELLSPQDVAHSVSQATDALQHAHDHHVIHQDVKPSNFLVRAYEDTSLPPDLLLSDFGVARLFSATSSISQSVRGTPTYMAPEQWEGEPVPATDQYALAVMAYELLTGKPPFQGGPGKMMYQHLQVSPQPPSALNSRLSQEIDSVVMRSLAKQPQERFASIRAFGNAFQQAVKEEARVQTLSSPGDLKVNSNVIPTIPADAPDMSAPVDVVAVTQVVGSDSQTFIKPENTPSTPLPQTLLIQTPQGDVRDIISFSPQVDKKDDQPPPFMQNSSLPARSRRRKRSFLALVAAILLGAALISGAVFALPALTGAIAGGHTNAPASRQSTSATSASITIVPASKALQNTFAIQAVPGTPDKSKHQYQGARYLSSSTTSYSQTVNATGQGTIPGTHASGTVCIDNFDTSAPITLQAGSVYGNTYPNAPFFHMVLDATESLPPAPSSSTFSQVCGPAHALEVGTIGNNIFNNNQFGTLTYSVFTNSSLRFTNGKDSQNYVAVQQSDINTAANALINANMPDAQQLLQSQLRAGEQFIGHPSCSPNVRANHRAGDNAPGVTVSVSFTCAGEVFEDSDARSFAAQLLAQQAITQLSSSYAAIGNTVTRIVSEQVTDSQQGTVTIMVDAQGKWLYHFTETQKQSLAKLIVGKQKGEAQSILLEQTGIAQAQIQLSGGNGVTLPTDANRITIVVTSISG